MESSTVASGKGFRIDRLVVGELATNCYLLVNRGSSRAFLIDPGAEGEAIQSVIRAQSIEIAAIINTHGHLDHIGADEFLRTALDVPIWIHEADGDCLTNPLKNLSFMTGFERKMLPADRLLKHGDKLELGSEALSVLHTPGHTPGSICLAADRYVITGDTLFVDSIGRTDLPGSDEDEMFRSLKKILAATKGDPLILPGHGGFDNFKLIRRTNPFLDGG